MSTLTTVWRTVQFFVTSSGVFEVETDGAGGYRCSCARTNCKHMRHCLRVAEENGGTYPVRVSHRATDKEIERAAKSPRRFRDLVLKYARVEVM